MHKGRVCGLGFRLSADGGLQLPAHCRRPDLGDREDGAQVGRCGGLCCPLALGMASSCCRPSRWNIYVAAQSLVCDQRRCAHHQRQ